MVPYLLSVSFIELYAHLLIAVPIVVAVILVAILIVVMAIKWQLWSARMRRARRAARAIKFRPDGQPYPPSGRGMCDICEQPHEKIYYLSDGQRLCPQCYATLEMSPEGQNSSLPPKESP